jgi:hypothetical protein
MSSPAAVGNAVGMKCYRSVKKGLAQIGIVPPLRTSEMTTPIVEWVDGYLLHGAGATTVRPDRHAHCQRAAPRYSDMKRSRSDSRVLRRSRSRVVFIFGLERARHAS